MLNSVKNTLRDQPWTNLWGRPIWSQTTGAGRSVVQKNMSEHVSRRVQVQVVNNTQQSLFLDDNRNIVITRIDPPLVRGLDE